MLSEEQKKEYYRMSFEAKKNDEKKYDTPENMKKYNWGTTDGWIKYDSNPVFTSDPNNIWDSGKVCACQVIKDKDYYYMLYLGHYHLQRGSIGLARSKDGKTNWERHPLNPIIAPDKDTWDAKSVFKPYAILDGDHWILWYNGGAWNYNYFD